MFHYNQLQLDRYKYTICPKAQTIFVRGWGRGLQISIWLKISLLRATVFENPSLKFVWLKSQQNFQLFTPAPKLIKTEHSEEWIETFKA